MAGCGTDVHIIQVHLYSWYSLIDSGCNYAILCLLDCQTDIHIAFQYLVCNGFLTSWNLYDIWGFHGSDDIDDDLLGLGTVWTGWYKPTFRRSVLSPSWGLTWSCQSHIATDGQSASPSWCRAPFGTHDQMSSLGLTVTVWVVVSRPLWREGGSVICHMPRSLSNLHINIYIWYSENIYTQYIDYKRYVHGLCQSGQCAADYAFLIIHYVITAVQSLERS
jgi:hypothetical protein